MIEHFGKVYRPVCDICGDALHKEYNWHDAVRAKRDSKWKTKKDEKGYWLDFCISCAEFDKDADSEN